MAMLVGTAALGAKAQGVRMVKGAPFTAKWTTTTEIEAHAEVTEEVTESVVARSTDGSIYQAFYKNGNLDRVEIRNVSRERRLVLYPKTKQYVVDPSDLTWSMPTVAQMYKSLEKTAGDYRRNYPLSHVNKVATSLGMKNVDGMTVFGHHYVRDGARAMEGDEWESELGFIYSGRYELYGGRRTVTVTLTELKREEPDPSLFKVPKGYSTLPDCMLNSVPPFESVNNRAGVRERPCRVEADVFPDYLH